MAFKLPIRIFRTPRHQRFEYKPRHWDPDKEEREQRLSHIKKLQEEGSVDSMKARISSGLKRGGRRNPEYRSKMVRESNKRLLMILALIVLVGFALLWIFLPEVLSAMLGIGS